MINRMLLENIGIQIRILRMANNLSQTDLAVLCEGHKTQIARIERGENDFRICTLNRIAEGLNVKLSDLVIAAEGIHNSSNS